jgi:hypothetical protein
VGEPLRNENKVSAALFSADGTRVVTASDDKTARVCDVDVRPPGASGLDLPADAAKALSVYKISENRALLPLQDWSARVKDLCRRVADDPPGEPAVRSCLHWLLEDPWTRTIAPYSAVIVPEFIRAQRRLCIPEARAERAIVGHPAFREAHDCEGSNRGRR